MLAPSRSAGLDARGCFEPTRSGRGRGGRAPALRLRSTAVWRCGGIATAGAPGTSGGETAFPAPVGSELIDNTAKMPGKKTGPVAERRQPIEGQLAGGPS